MKRSPLHNLHIGLNARLTTFAGWEMPLEYATITDEHNSVRSAAGLFDISHLGQIEVTGKRALDALQSLLTNDLSVMKDGQVQYNLICNNNGGIIDDLTVYRFSSERFILCVNAANTEKDLEWLSERADKSSVVKDVSSEFAVLAIQGPLSAQILGKVCGMDLAGIRPFRFAQGKVAGMQAVISRTGYTGEDGFEIYTGSDNAERVWNALMEAGSPLGIRACGLGARDSLRLEMGYPLHGNDITVDITPVEAGLERFVSLHKLRFTGKEAIVKTEGEGVKKRLIGFEMIGRGVPRPHYIISSGGNKIGEVTSGGHSPSLDRFIGMGYVATPYSLKGTKIDIDIRGKMSGAIVVQRPFYSRRPLTSTK